MRGPCWWEAAWLQRANRPRLVRIFPCLFCVSSDPTRKIVIKRVRSRRIGTRLIPNCKADRDLFDFRCENHGKPIFQNLYFFLKALKWETQIPQGMHIPRPRQRKTTASNLRSSEVINQERLSSLRRVGSSPRAKHWQISENWLKITEQINKKLMKNCWTFSILHQFFINLSLIVIICSLIFHYPKDCVAPLLASGIAKHVTMTRKPKSCQARL